MMAAGAVDMAVGDLLGGGFTHLADRDVKVERHAGERMIPVESQLALRTSTDLRPPYPPPHTPFVNRLGLGTVTLT